MLWQGKKNMHGTVFLWPGYEDGEEEWEDEEEVKDRNWGDDEEVVVLEEVAHSYWLCSREVSVEGDVLRTMGGARGDAGPQLVPRRGRMVGVCQWQKVSTVSGARRQQREQLGEAEPVQGEGQRRVVGAAIDLRGGLGFPVSFVPA